MTEYRTARPESLEQVFFCYTKDNLQDIAKKHGLKGFSKWNKKDLAKWLRDQLLDEAVMGEIVKQTSADENIWGYDFKNVRRIIWQSARFS